MERIDNLTKTDRNFLTCQKLLTGQHRRLLNNVPLRNVIVVIVAILTFVSQASGAHPRQCLASKKTMHFVQSCPKNEKEWKEAVRLKNCQSVQQNCSSTELFRYHCLIEETGLKLIEVCAPTIFVIGSSCAEYNTIANVIQSRFDYSCADSISNCPIMYRSHETYKYQSCYEFLKQETTYANDNKKTFTTFKKTNDTIETTSVIGERSSLLPTSNTTVSLTDNNEDVKIFFSVVVPTIAIAIMVVNMMIYYRKRRHREIPEGDIDMEEREFLLQHKDNSIYSKKDKKEALDQEGKNILDNTKAVLQNHKSSITYSRTGQVDSVIETLREKHIVILTGRPGDGKSTIAKQVLCELSEDGEYVPVIITKPNHWTKVVNSYQKMVVYIQDVFGSTNVDYDAIEKWKQKLELTISSAFEGNIFVLTSSRSNIIAKVRNSCSERFLDPEYEKELASNVLTSKEKESILHQYEQIHIYRTSELIGDEFRTYEKRHGKDVVYKLSELDIARIVESEPYYGFPQTCFLFFAIKEFFQLGTNFFLRANKTLFENIDNMRKSTAVRTKMQYCTLAYVFLEGNAHLWDIKEDIFQEICKMLSLPYWTKVDVEDAVHDLEGKYLSPSKQTHVFTFCHVTIQETVAASFGKLAPDIVIQKCSDEILYELIRTEGYEARDGEVILTIEKKYYPLLADRLLTASTWYRARHPATDDAEFTSVLFDVINNSPHNSRTIIKQIWDKLEFVDKPVLYKEILTRHGPHHIKHTDEYESDLSGYECDSDTSVERPYLITCEEVKGRLDGHLCWGHKQRSIVIVRYVINNCDVNYFLNSYNDICNIPGMSVLHCCVALGWTDVVDEILNVVTPTKTENNWSCLHFAAFFARFELFKKFEKLRSNVLETTREGYNVLQVMLLRLRYGIIKSDSVSYYLSVSDTDGNKINFMNVSEHETDFVNILQHLMTGYPSLITSMDMPLDDFNNNIIHYLVIHDREEIYDMLVNKKKDLIFNPNDTELPTTLHVAAYLGRVKFVEQLWKAGVRTRDTDISIAKCVENGQIYADRTLTHAFHFETKMYQWLDQQGTVINNIKLKFIKDQPVRFGCTEDYTAISSICIADN